MKQPLNPKVAAAAAVAVAAVAAAVVENGAAAAVVAVAVVPANTHALQLSISKRETQLRLISQVRMRFYRSTVVVNVCGEQSSL